MLVKNEKGTIVSFDSIEPIVIGLYNGLYSLLNKEEQEENGIKNYLLIKREISKYTDSIPLYDVFSNRIFLIHYTNVYPRINYENYRTVSSQFYNNLLELQNHESFTDADKDNLRILSNYDFPTLEQTYNSLFYQSYILNSYITDCRRPSFSSRMNHILPYYGINELYYLGADWDLVDSNNLSYDQLQSLCNTVSKYDINGSILLNHQIYIYDNNKIGLVKYYSLSGSYFLNRYLRNPPEYKNLLLEKQINMTQELIKSAPAFDRDNYVYRFIEEDSFLQHLKKGDIYTDRAFMSTTRNPFTYQENYQFGYILMKIKILGNIPGIGLCVESYSNFPNEEEIILPPLSKLRLDKIVDNERINSFIKKKIQKKYEFTLLGTDTNIVYPNRLPTDKYISIDEQVNILSNTKLTLRTNQFLANMNEINQFITTVGENITFTLESYDSSTVYSPFFYYETTFGLMLYSIGENGNINLLIELGRDIHINYYFKYSISETSDQLNLNNQEWIDWLSKLAFVTGAHRIIFHANYVLGKNDNDTALDKQIKTRYTYTQDIYEYLKNRTRYYESSYISPAFDYTQLEYLRTFECSQIIVKEDRNELYSIVMANNLTYLSDLYIYLVENNPKLLDIYYQKIKKKYNDNINPFMNTYYTMNPWSYLIDKGIIRTEPRDTDFGQQKRAYRKFYKYLPQFRNRLRDAIII